MSRLLSAGFFMDPDPAAGGSNAGTGGATGGEGGGVSPAPGGGTVTPPLEGGVGTGNPWFGGFKAADVKAYVETKGFKDPESLALAYQNLEKIRGVPADRLVTLPGDDKPESWAPVYDRLGRPKEAAGYELPSAQDVPPDFLKWQGDTFHKLGLNKKQAQGLSQEWNALVAHSKQVDTQNTATKRNEQITALRQEWGQAAGAMGDRVDAMVTALGMDENTVNAIEGAMGFDGFSKFMIAVQDKFGIKLSESEFHGGQNGGNDFGAMTPNVAKGRREELLSNEEYRKSWESGDKAKIKEIDRLYAIQYQNG